MQPKSCMLGAWARPSEGKLNKIQPISKTKMIPKKVVHVEQSLQSKNKECTKAFNY